VLERCELEATVPEHENPKRRNITVRPGGGTRVVVRDRVPAREPVPA
jgi:hypothetical protein